jgi:GNAT superfamily N-acetyltransferase
MPTIEKITVRDLPAFAARCVANLNQQDVIPITSVRARAHANNPHADGNDIGLLVAYEDNRCIGYLGIMPGMLKVLNKFSKVHWFSTFYTAPQYRGKGIGLTLVQVALSLGYDFVSSPLTGTRSEQVFVQAGMLKFAVWEYCAVDIRTLNLVTMPPRLMRLILRTARKDMPCLNGAIRTLDKLCLPLLKNIFYGLLGQSARRTGEAACEKMVAIPDDLVKKYASRKPSPAFVRDAASINWMFNYTWLKEKPQADSADKRYFFSGLPDSFEFIPLAIRNADNTTNAGFIILSLNTTKPLSTLKVLDYFHDDAGQIASVILQISAQHRAGCIEYPSSLAPSLEKKLVMKLLCVRKRRTYLYHPAHAHSPLAQAMPDIHLDYGDGDNTFF